MNEIKKIICPDCASYIFYRETDEYIICKCCGFEKKNDERNVDIKLKDYARKTKLLTKPAFICHKCLSKNTYKNINSFSEDYIKGYIECMFCKCKITFEEIRKNE